MMKASHESLALLAGQLAPGGRLLRFWPLKGGVSAQVTALELALPDGPVERLVVRRHSAAELRRNPQVAASEFKLLQILHPAGLPVPMPRYLDQTGAIFPEPYLVTAYIEGGPASAPADESELVIQLATLLARIHTIDPAAHSLSFLPRQEEVCATILRPLPAAAIEPAVRHARDTLAAAWPLPRRNAPMLLHGDFWPGNIIWRDSEIAAVIDWEDAAVGDPLSDLANARLELLWALGEKGMEQFTRRYQQLTRLDSAHLPHWELCVALKPAATIGSWGLDPDVERRMREGLRWFMAQALARMGRGRS